MNDKVVFLYPGQGAQHVGMGSDLYQTYAEARRVFDWADRLLGFSLSRLCFEGPEEYLNKDLNAQFAIYTLSCCLTDVLRVKGIFPDTVCGYSSGFYAAAYAGGCFDFDQGLRIVRRAGEILLNEGRKIDGSMAVIFGLSPENVDHICRKIQHVEISIVNTPRQIIISGLDASVKRAMALAMDDGALDAYKISAETAYHSEFMKHGSKRLLREIGHQPLRKPLVPLLSYLTLNDITNQKDLKSTMAAQLSGPVMWVDLIRMLVRRNARLLIEVGPGYLISRTVRWIDRSLQVMATSTTEDLTATIDSYQRIKSK
ncbi:MAG: ACP S-malonyltransferase [Desulfobacterales bacterium]|nr:MAG: ACP S-malonyltransferase [Desulfobacterales bacterium]